MKLITLIAAMLVCFASFGQTASTPAIDTSTDAETIYLVSPTSYFNGATGVWSVSYAGTKISGTTAGYAIIQGSIDGTNYTNVYNTSADSFALANTSGAQVKNWYLNNVRVSKARIKIVTTGTQSTQQKVHFIKN